MEEEIWKFYKDTRCYKKDGTLYQGSLWEVSNYGNIKRNNIIIHPITKNNDTYKRFRRGDFVHRVVAELFIPNPENKPCVDHIDGNKLNNHYSNLRWVTHKENMNNPITVKRIHTDLWRNHLKGKHRVYDDKELNKYHYEN